MGIQKPFVVRNGLEVSVDGLVVESPSLNVGIGTTNPQYDLDVVGNINYTGTLYKNGVPVSFGGTGTGSGDNYWENITVGIYTSTNVYVGGDITLNANTGIISANGLSLNGVLIEGANDRQVSRVIATAGQTNFNINYTIGFIDVFLNGSRLSNVEYTANDGYNVILTTPASEGDEIQLIADRTFSISNLASASGRNIESFVATSSQTLFAATYTPGFVDVFLNGSRLNESEYVATNGTTVSLVNPATEGDEVVIVSFIMVDPNSAGYASKQETYFVATAGQTNFSANYTVGYVDVYLNGSKLTKTEYSATNGQTVVLTNPATLGDEIEIISFQLVDPNVLNPASRSIYYFSASAAQDTFVVNYTVGYIDVYLNGAKLTPSEYTATNGTSVVLTTPATEGDDIEIVSFIMVDPALSNFWVQNLAGIHTLSNIGVGTTNPTSALTVNGNVYVTGVITATAFVGDGSGLTNLPGGGGGGSSQWSTTSAGIHTLSNVGIGTTNPTSALTVEGDVLVSGVVTATAFYGDGSALTGISTGSGAFSYCCTNNITSTNLTSHPDITSATNNFFAGVGAGCSITSGSYNNFFGSNAGRCNTTGGYNNFFGRCSGYYNTSGYNNVFIGDSSGYNNFSGFSNIFIGPESGYSNTNGNYNNFFGCRAGYYSDGNYNNFFGKYAGYSNISASSNNFFGLCSGYYNTSGSYNDFIGYESGCRNTTGTRNIAIGAYTYGPTTGVGNFLGGYAAGYAGMTDSSYNVFLGWYAGGCADQGYSCYNNFIGYLSGGCNSDGCYNNFFGRCSGFNNNSGNYNNFFGENAGFSNGGSNNNFFGTLSGNTNTTGNYNSFFGAHSGRSNDSGSHNNFFGSYTGISTTASDKVIIGRGYNSSNLFDSPDTTKDTQLAIGIRTFTTPANYWIVGDENFNIGLGVTAPTSKLHVGGGINIGTASTASIGDGDIGSSGGPDLMFGIYNVSAGGTITFNTYNQANVFNETLSLRYNHANFNSNIYVSGVVTATAFVGDGSGLTNLPSGGSSSQWVTTGAGIHTLSNVGIGTTNPTSKLTISGNVLVSGVVTATAFVGDGSGLTNLPSSGGINYWGQNSSGIHTLSKIGIGTTNAAGAITIGSTAEIRFTSTNVKIGDNTTGPAITSGIHNNFIGNFAGRNTTSGCFNNFMGRYAGCCNTSGESNNFFGDQAGRSNESGSHNNFFGKRAGSSNTDNFNNFFGYYSGLSNTSGSHNNFFGLRAGQTNTSGGNNTFIGQLAGQGNTTGSDNNFIGRCAGASNTSGTYNSFFGRCAGHGNTTGIRNSVFGAQAATSLSGGCSSIFGSFAGGGSGNLNSFFGYSSGSANSSGTCNSFFGAYAGSQNTTGSCNAYFGREAGCSNTTGSLNVVIGPLRNSTPISNGSNQLVIGSGSNDWIIGNSSYNVGIGTTNPTSKLDVVGNVSVAGTTRVRGFVETQSTPTLSSDVLLLNAANGTVFAHTTSSQIGIVSFSGISTTGPNVQTFTVLLTQGSTPVNTTPQTGIGTQTSTIRTTDGTNLTANIRVGGGTTIVLTNSAGALDVLNFVVSYNGVSVASTNFTIIGMASTDFRSVI